MGLESGDDPGDCVDKVVSLHHLECWETRQAVLSLPPSPQSGQGTIPTIPLPQTCMHTPQERTHTCIALTIDRLL